MPYPLAPAARRRYGPIGPTRTGTLAMFTPDQNRQQAVFDRLRQGILAGTLPAGARLPPTRALADELGVARQTVVLAYERLASEGYVRARTGSGTYVAPDLPDAAPAPATPPPTAASSLSHRGQRIAAVPVSAHQRQPDLGTLLAGGIPAPDLFPREAWARCAAKVMKALPSRPDRLPLRPGPARPAHPDRRPSRRHARPARRPRQHRGHRRHPAGAAHRRRPAAGPRRHRLGRGPRLHRRPRRPARRRRHPGPRHQRHRGPRRRRRHPARPRRAAGAGRAVARHAAGRRAADRPPAGAAGLGRPRQRLDPGGRLRLGIPLDRPSAAAARHARSRRPRDLLRHLQQDAGARRCALASPWSPRPWCPPSSAPAP